MPDRMGKQQIDSIVKSAVIETLTSLGLSVGEPLELQKDFAHLRNLREGSETIKKNVIKAFITASVPTFVYVIWQAIKEAVHK